LADTHAAFAIPVLSAMGLDDWRKLKAYLDESAMEHPEMTGLHLK